MVFEAVQQFAANNIGCLVTVNDSGTWQAESTGWLVGWLDYDKLEILFFVVEVDDDQFFQAEYCSD